MGTSAYLCPCLWMTLSLNMSLQDACPCVKWIQTGFKYNMPPGLCMHWCVCVCVCVWERERETETETERQRKTETETQESTYPFSVCMSHVSQSLCGTVSAWVGMCWCLLLIVCPSQCLPYHLVYQCLHVCVCNWAVLVIFRYQCQISVLVHVCVYLAPYILVRVNLSLTVCECCCVWTSLCGLTAWEGTHIFLGSSLPLSS